MAESVLFSGFEDPSANYYRLPNSWFDIMRQLREATDDRIAGAVKLLEYVLKHTWGYQRFDGQVRLSAEEIRNGRKFKGRRLDQGTQLAENSVRKATEMLAEFGAIEVIQSDDAARRIRTYRPHLRPEVEPPNDRVPEEFTGFNPPQANYFKVPNIWTNIARPVQSAATILVVEYFFRHAWGYHNPDGVWLDAEQIAHGRQYANGRRYDQGVGYDAKTVYRAVQEALTLKLLVWAEREECGIVRRVYNLRWKGLHIDGETGEYLGPLPWDEPESASRNSEVVVRNCEGDGLRATDNSEVVLDNCEVVSRNSEAVVRNPEARADNCEARTARPHTLTDTSDTLTDTPATETGDTITVDSPLFAVVAGGNEFLQELGIESPALRRILKLELSPEVVMAWTLYAWSQEALDRNKAGFLIKRLLSDEDAYRPPERFLCFARLTWCDWCDLWKLTEPYSRLGIDDLPAALRPIAPLWLRVYYPRKPEALPDEVREKLEALTSEDLGKADLDGEDEIDEIEPDKQPT